MLLLFHRYLTGKFLKYLKRSIDRQLPEIYETLHCTFAHCWLKQCVPDIVIIIWPFITERCHIIRRWSHQGTMPSLRWFKVSLSKRGLFIFSIKNISTYAFVKWACFRVLLLVTLSLFWNIGANDVVDAHALHWFVPPNVSMQSTSLPHHSLYL